MNWFLYYFLLFFSYSVMGWICETICCSLGQKKLVLNRGFLLGPYLPIYGYGAIFMVLFLKKYLDDPIALFIMASVGASVLEYVTSYAMEKLFKARWWDYSDKSFNINGRICLKNSILFGLLGIVVMYVIHPIYAGWLSKLPELLLRILSIIFLIIYLVDNLISFIIMFQIRSNATLLLKDSTHIISKQVREVLARNRVLKQRLLNAFPSAMILDHEKLFATIRKNLTKLEKKKK